MKHYLKLFLVILLFLPSLACRTFSTNFVQGSGKIVKQTVDVNNFDRVSLEGSGNVYIKQSSKESLTIEADDNILPLLETRVTGNVSGNGNLSYYGTPTIDHSVSGSGKLISLGEK